MYIKYHDPEFPEGEYTINGDDSQVAKEGLRIRVERSTKNDGSIIGWYKQNDTFTVYQVFPAEAGITWGRVSPNTSGTIHYCGLKVNNHRKAVLLQAQNPPEIPTGEPRVSVEGLMEMYGYLKTLGYMGKPPVIK